MNETIDMARRYLRQQAELYGDTLILSDADADVSAPVAAGPSNTWHALLNRVESCQACALAASRNHIVFGEGNLHANLMLIAEAPGEEEDKQGKPFVGSAGQLLDKILAAVDFSRDEVYIGNILKCRPPQNRDPRPEEIKACLPHLVEQILLIQPRIILALGRVAGQVLLNTEASLSKMRQTIHQYQDIPLMVTYHPAALLRNAHWKRPVWEDVQKMRKLYDEIAGDKPPWQPRKR